MKKLTFLFIMLCCGISAMASLKTTTDPVKLVAELKAEVLSVKKDMLKIYPKFGSVGNINAQTVARAVNKLSDGSTVEMLESIELETGYKIISVDNWYINKINATSSVDKKKALAKEYVDTEKLLSIVGEILAQGSALENFGGTMANLGYAGGHLMVYSGWLEDIKQSPRLDPMSAEDAEDFVKHVKEWWSSRFDETLSWAEDYEADELRKLDTEVKAQLRELSTHIKTCKVGYWLEACFEQETEY